MYLVLQVSFFIKYLLFYVIWYHDCVDFYYYTIITIIVTIITIIIYMYLIRTCLII